jgi:UDP-N-acetylglucosamine 2-epimerase (non-hydrolysing)
LRDVTERPETIEVGSNILSGAEPEAIRLAVKVAIDSNRSWSPPAEYLQADVSVAVSKILLGFQHNLYQS